MLPKVRRTVLLSVGLAMIIVGAGWFVLAQNQGISKELNQNTVKAQLVSMEMEHLHALAIDPSTNTLFKGSHNGLYQSTDEGKTWTKIEVKSSLGSTDVMALAIDPADPKTIYAAGHDLWVVKSEDGGKSWREIKQGLTGSDVHGLAIDPNNPKRLYAWIVEKGLFLTSDTGESWRRVDDGPPAADVKTLLSVNISTGMGGIFLAAATPSGLFFSADCF